MHIPFRSKLHAFEREWLDGQESRGNLPEEKLFINPFHGDSDACPLQIALLGQSQWYEKNFWERKVSNIFAIEMVTAGNLVLIQNGRTFEVEHGQAFILQKGASNHYTTGSAGFMLKRYVQFSGYLLDSFISASGLDRVDVLPTFDAAKFRSLWKESRDVIEKKGPGFFEEISTLAYRMIMLCAGCVGPQYEPIVKNTIEFIKRNIKQPLSDEEIAREARVSICHIRTIFKRATGFTPLQYHTREKIASAQQLLKGTSLSVKEIADHCGFEDPLYFSKVFKRIAGKSPSQYCRCR